MSVCKFVLHYQINVAIVSLLIFASSFALADGLLCSKLFEVYEPSQNMIKNMNFTSLDSTSSFISYFQETMHLQIIEKKDFENFLEALEFGKLINPIPHEINQHGVFFIKSSHQIHFYAFEKYLSEGKIDITQIKDWARKVQKEQNRTEVKRKRTHETTTEIHQKIEFQPVAPGQFMMEAGSQNQTPRFVQITITKSFEMMSTPLTQMMWAYIQIIAGETTIEKINPSNFKIGQDSRIVKIKDFNIRMRPDNPVETVSWNDIEEFISTLNKISKSEDAETQALLNSIIPSHQKGDVYRLPTEAEWTFVIKGRGQLNDLYHFGNDEIQLEQYAWFRDNSDGQTHPVGLKKPLKFGSVEFFDLHGNISEWVFDLQQFDNQFTDASDPQGPLIGTSKNRVFRNSAWNSRGFHLQSRHRSNAMPETKWPTLGFRLVREVK